MRQLTERAQEDRDEFDSLDGSCSCHLNPPCYYCTHEGNPDNQEDNEACWEEVGDSDANTRK